GITATWWHPSGSATRNPLLRGGCRTWKLLPIRQDAVRRMQNAPGNRARGVLMSSRRSSWDARRTRCLTLLAASFVGACSNSATPTGRFTRVADMLTPRYSSSSARLPDGRIIVVGGVVGNSIKDPADQTSSTEIYDAGSNQWTSAAPVPLRVPVINTLASLS